HRPTSTSTVLGPGISNGAPPNGRGAIRDLIRQKLHDGRLPRGSAPRAFGRPGNWQRCEACEGTMPKALHMMHVYTLTNEKGHSLSRRLLHALERRAARDGIVASTALTPLS